MVNNKLQKLEISSEIFGSFSFPLVDASVVLLVEQVAMEEV